jgi:hypothetical protein
VTCHSPHASSSNPKTVKAADTCKACVHAPVDIEKTMPGTASTAGNLFVRTHTFNPASTHKGGPTATNAPEPAYFYKK